MQILYDPTLFILYFTVFTFLPISVVALRDKHLNSKTLMIYPQLYPFYRKMPAFSFPNFFLICFFSFFHSFFLLVFSFYGMEQELESQLLIGSVSYVCVMVVISLLLFVILKTPSVWELAAVLATFFLFILCQILFSSSIFYTAFYNFRVFHTVLKTPSFWLTCLACVVVLVGSITSLQYYRHQYRPSDIRILRERLMLSRQRYTYVDDEGAEDDNENNEVLNIPM
eukprot:Lithocolla_globosa_v1_NODE_6829_length_1030_cov_3.441026.p1 type:complete len:226 gc:universal NODE_6829_length_1030_cov_3.441026:294-971(+)